MNASNDQTLTALRLIFASETYESLCSEIEDIYQSELKAARDRTLQTAKKMIEGQLNNLPTLTFGVDNLSDSDLESLASGFIPTGCSLD